MRTNKQPKLQTAHGALAWVALAGNGKSWGFASLEVQSSEGDEVWAEKVEGSMVLARDLGFSPCRLAGKGRLAP